MNRTIIYARVSTEDQLEKYGLPSQLRACREYAASHELAVLEQITDEGISGTVLARPGLESLRHKVAAGECDIVLMLDADRLSRELAHLLILKPEIEKKARLEFVTAKFEDSPSGRMFFGIRGVIAQYERELTRERTMRGKWERARTGKIVGGRVAYGYRYEDGLLELDEEKSLIAREIFTRFDAGESMRSITLWLRASGAPTWSGRTWGHSSVRRILINETYAGVAHYGTHRREGTLLRRREDLENRISLIVPATVPRDLWERVQARIGHKAIMGRPSDRYLLRGLLHCGACGRRMNGDRRRSYLSYRCAGRDAMRVKAGEPCHVCVNARALDGAVWESLATLLTDADLLRGLLTEHAEELRGDATPEKDARVLERQIKRLKAREQRCLTMLVESDLGAEGQEMLKQKYREIQRERLWIEQEITKRTAREKQLTSAEQWLDETVDLLREYIPGIIDPDERQQFVRSLVSRADWDGAEVVLQCFLGAKVGQASGRSELSERVTFTVSVGVSAA